MNGSGHWPSSGHTVRLFGHGSGGESLAQFHATVREVHNEIGDEPESTVAELATAIGLTLDAVERAVLHLLNERRILATFGRHKVQTFRVNRDWRQPEPAEVVACALTPFSASLRNQD